MSQSPTRLVLSRARAKIESPRTWLQHAYKQGNQYVQKRCAYQALADAAEELNLGLSGPVGALSQAIGGGARNDESAIIAFNDSSQHADVLALFDKALETV